MPCPVGFVLGLVDTTLNWTFERGFLDFEIGKEFVLEMLSQMLNFTKFLSQEEFPLS